MKIRKQRATLQTIFCARCAARMAGSLSFALAALSVGAADYTVSYGGGTTTVSVVMGKTVDIDNVQDGDSVALETALTGTHKTDVLVKDGPGTLVMSKDIKAFTGEVLVKTGGLKLAALYAIGADGTSYESPGAAVRVLDGATLYVDGSSYNAEQAFKYRPFYFGGFGEAGSGGAFVGSKGKVYGSFWRSTKTLLSDARMSGVGSQRLDIRAGTLDMLGHTLYLTNTIGFTGMTVVNPGNIVADPGASITLENHPIFGGSAANVFTLNKNASLIFRTSTNAIAWKLYVPQSANICEASTQSSGTNYNVWAGPVEIASGAVLTNTQKNVTLAGKVSGAGSLAVKDGTLNLTSCENDLTGEISVSGGALNVYGTGSLPYLDTAHIKFTNGSINMYFNDSDRADVNKMTKILDFNTTSRAIGFGSDETIPLTNGYSAAKTEKTGNSTLTLTGDGAEGSRDLGGIRVSYGSLILNDLGFVNGGIYGGNYIGDVWPRRAYLVFDSGTCYAATVQPKSDATDNYNKSYVHVGSRGYSTSKVRGIVEIRDGAVVSNRVNLGYSWNSYNDTLSYDGQYPSCGALYQRGGRFVSGYTNRAGGVYVGGGGGSGYEEITGGYRLIGVSFGLWCQYGYEGASAGVLSVLGGTFEQLGQGMTIAANSGTGEVHVANGTFKPGNFTIGGFAWRKQELGGMAVFNQVGGTTFGGNIYMGGMSNGVSIASFGGGTFSANRFYGVTNRLCLSGSANIPYPLSVTRKYVNFNGTTFRRYGGNARLFEKEFTRFTVFPGGLTFSTENENGSSGTCTFDYPLQAPEGKGISKIAVPSQGATPWNYIGAPFVWIIDPTGQGYGASAHADFDSAAGTITNITVVSPGCNYGEGTYAVLDYAGFTNRVTIAAKDVTLADNVSGGLVKIGTGTFKLKAANTYTGWTRVEKGTLDVTVAGSYPASSPLDLAGGNLLCAANTTLNVPQLKGNAGSVNANVTVTDALVVDCAAMTSGEQYVINGTLNLNGARIVVTNVSEDKNFRLNRFVSATGGITGDYTVEGIAEPWHIFRQSDALSLRCRKGLSIIVH